MKNRVLWAVLTASVMALADAEARAAELAALRGAIVTVEYGQSRQFPGPAPPEGPATGSAASSAARGFRVPPSTTTVTGFWIGKTQLVTVLPPDATTQLQVVLARGVESKAERVAFDPLSGVAILELPSAFEASATIGPTEGAVNWASPVTILSAWKPGNPALTRGVVATDVSFDAELRTDVFDVDAVVRESAAGSPVLDDQQRLIGVLKATRSTDNAVGPGIVVSTTVVKRLQQFVAAGREGPMPMAYLGISVMEDGQQVIVGNVASQSPADAAGFARGDTVVAIADQSVKRSEELLRAIASCKVGETVRMKVRRDGELMDREVKLAERVPANRLPVVTVVQPMMLDWQAERGPGNHQAIFGAGYPRVARGAAKPFETQPVAPPAADSEAGAGAEALPGRGGENPLDDEANLRGIFPSSRPAPQVFGLPRDLIEQLHELPKQIEGLREDVQELRERMERPLPETQGARLRLRPELISTVDRLAATVSFRDC